MKPPKPIDIKAVSEFIEIDETMASGLRWKKAPKYNSQVLGRQAGCPHKGGYYVFGLNHRHYLAHRVIMVLSCGYDRPDMEVDHIDGDVSNNSPSNLRWADRKLQTQNRRSKGMPYACWHKRRKKWQCRATVDGKRLHNGYYDTEAEASAAGVLRFGPRR